MKLTQRDRRAIVLGVGILAAVLLVKFVLLPWRDSWSEARDEIARRRAEMSQLEAKMLRLTNSQEAARRIYGPSATKPPEGGEAARIAFTKAVQDILSAGGIQFESITPQPPRTLRELPDVQFVPFQIKGKCAAAQLAQCLAGMRNSPMPVIVDRIQMSGIQKSPGQVELTLVLGTLAKQEKQERKGS